jgi:hypothetical protein
MMVCSTDSCRRTNVVSFDIVYHQDVIAHQAMRRRRASRAARGAGAYGSGVADAVMDRDMVPRADGQPHVRHDHGIDRDGAREPLDPRSAVIVRALPVLRLTRHRGPASRTWRAILARNASQPANACDWPYPLVPAGGATTHTIVCRRPRDGYVRTPGPCDVRRPVIIIAGRQCAPIGRIGGSAPLGAVSTMYMAPARHRSMLARQGCATSRWQCLAARDPHASCPTLTRSLCYDETAERHAPWDDR